MNTRKQIERADSLALEIRGHMFKIHKLLQELTCIHQSLEGKIRRAKDEQPN